MASLAGFKESCSSFFWELSVLLSMPAAFIKKIHRSANTCFLHRLQINIAPFFLIKFHLSSSAGRGKSSGFTPAFFILAPHSPQYLTATQLMKWHFLQRKCSQVHRPGFSSHSDSSGGTSGRKIFAVFLPGSATVTRVIFLIFALDMRISSVPSLSRSNNAALISVHPHTLRISHHRQALCCPALRSALWSAAADPNGSMVYRTPHSSSRPPACHAMPRRGE